LFSVGVIFMMDALLLGQLMDTHAAALTHYARQWCLAPEDVVQEAFLKLAAQGSMPTAVVPWLYRVVRNLAISAARAEHRRRRHETQAGNQHPNWFVSQIDSVLDGAQATQALRQLPPEQREVIMLHIWGGLSFTEIADVLGCASSSAHRWYVAGLQQLRERIAPCPNPSNPISAPLN
jgi:RNA polymerase sigma factor (sigma-70 family)